MRKVNVKEKVNIKERLLKERLLKERLFFLCIRYFVAIVVGIFIQIFYIIFTPLTLFSLKKILSLFFEIYVYENFIIHYSFTIAIIPACIGGSAYYLLFVLNFLTPNIKAKKRIFVLFFSFLLFFLFNLFRLIFLISLELSGIKTYFYHKLFWYLGSTLAVFLIWICTIKIFKISSIPFYSDLTWLIKLKKKLAK
ncbi:MAG: pacearchaeosortase [Candidatus Omnitrophica bacterium]|nr:pacearchaeosortase [Candidatus Omnitrophota bacterium]